MRKIFLLILTLFISVSLLSQQTWTSNGSGLWSSASTWTTSGGATGAPPTTLNSTKQVIITNGHTVTLADNLQMENSSVLTIENGGKLKMGNSGFQSPVLNMKSADNKFYINNGTYESYTPASGGNMVFDKGLIDWRDATVSSSGIVTLKNSVDNVTMINTCLRAAQNILFQGVGASGSWALLNNVYLLAGTSGNGTFSVTSSSFLNVTDLRIKTGSQNGTVELFNSQMTGSVYSIYGNQKIQINNMTGTTSLQYYCATTLDPNLNYFTGPKTNNCTVAQAQDCSGLLPQADLAVTSVITPNPVYAGQQVTCTITVTNNGPASAASVVVSDNLPVALSVVSSTPSAGAWTAPSWNIGTMTSGATATLTILATVNSSYSGTLNNSASVATSTTDPTSGNNAATGTTNVVTPTGPDAVNDNITTSKFTPATFNVVSNDIAGSSAIVNTSVALVSGTLPDPSTVGVFSVNPADGMVTFTPAGAFTGTATANYTVCDAFGLCDNATISVNVIPGYSVFYPATGPGSLAFEDLWPSKGDYDFNDLVVDYQFEIIANTSNFVEEINAVFVVKAYGASFKNGFGFQFPAAIDADDLTVTGSDLTEGYITLASNGTETGQTKPTIIVFDNCKTQLPHPGTGIGVNVTLGAPYVTPKTLNIHITFKPNTYTLDVLDISNFNPFLIKNSDRTKEVHLPYFPPTDLADPAIFGTFEDNSVPSQGRYYVTESNLPWALNIYEVFDYPVEKQEIITAYLKFAEWAMSGGTVFNDWYKDIQGYRNPAFIYHHP